MRKATPHPVVEQSAYGYTPTEYVCIIFVVLFSLSTLAHAVQAARYRMWFLLSTACFAGVLEILGWAGRLWSAINPLTFKAYEMQIVCTIMGPTPLAAANFVILGLVIRRLGPEYSRLSPTAYTVLFLCCDIVSLIVQAIGGGAAATAVNMFKDPKKGGNIMLGGIAFQMVTITAYVLCAGEFILRYLSNRPVRAAASREANADDDNRTATPGSGDTRKALSPRMKVLLCALIFNTTCLFIRAVYRVIELADGWGGRIIHTQVYFNVLDGAMITLAIITLNVFHPGYLLETPARATKVDEKEI
ncbi:unnamed protein product [Mycena citricolor]|uniref:RTA1-domain-containing protein n=1 Tax=Mycena citricolor TaxID=2018698 RepID=A0AAD2HWM3_9AGAR|nr:unnamed protein product [Mycena citricolor]